LQSDAAVFFQKIASNTTIQFKPFEMATQALFRSAGFDKEYPLLQAVLVLLHNN